MANSMSEYRQNGVDYIIDDPTVAPVFVDSTAYTAGQYVKHQGNLYRFIADHAAGAWNASHVTQITVGGEIAAEQTARQSAIEAEQTARLAGDAAVLAQMAPEFAEGTANTAGEYVTYQGTVYKLPAGHDVGTTWANTQKVATNLGSSISDLNRALNKCSNGMFFVQKEDEIGGSNNWNVEDGEIWATSAVGPYNYCAISEKEITFNVMNPTAYTLQLWIGIYDGKGGIVTCITNTSAIGFRKYFQDGSYENFTNCTVNKNTPIYLTKGQTYLFEAIYNDKVLSVKCDQNEILKVTFQSDIFQGISFLNYSLDSDKKLTNVRKNIYNAIGKAFEKADRATDNTILLRHDVNAIATITPVQTINMKTIDLDEGYYWGYGGKSAISTLGKTYYAARYLIQTTPNTLIELVNFGSAVDNSGLAIIGMYDNDGNDAPGRINLGDTEVQSYTIENDIFKSIIIKTSSSCTQLGLYFFVTAPKTLQTIDDPILKKTLNPGVQFSASSEDEIKEIAQELIDESTGENDAIRAEYYQKGFAPKLARTKKLCIIGAGQSNIDGRNPVSDLPSGITLPMTGMKYIKNALNGQFENAFPSVQLWGFDLITCHELINNLGSGNLYYIKWSEGGTSIDPTGATTHHWTADYEKLPSLNDALLYKFNQEIQKCDSVNPGEYEIGAMIWHQGEGDNVSQTAIANYYTNFKKVIAFCRGITGNKCLPFICGTVPESSAQYSSVIDTAIRTLGEEDPYMWVVDMSDAQLQDSYHFNAAWSEYFGKKVYDCMIDAGVITGSKINPPKPE